VAEQAFSSFSALIRRSVAHRAHIDQGAFCDKRLTDVRRYFYAVAQRDIFPCDHLVKVNADTKEVVVWKEKVVLFDRICCLKC